METSQTKKFVYQQKPKNGMVLLTFKKEENFSKDNHPGSLSQYEWNRKFNLEKIKSTWKQKAETNFQINEQKFPFNIVSQEVLESKQYVKDLLENDVLEINKKRWNVSSKVIGKEKKDHKKRLFELKHGLISFSSTPKHQKKKPMAISSNDLYTTNYNNERWNIKATLDSDEKKEIINRIKCSSKKNSKTYWHEHSKTSDKIGDSYISPYDKYTNDLKLLKKIKEETELKREDIEKKVCFLNPGALNYPEKINAIVYKEMKGIYENKLNEKNTKQSDKETKHNQKQKFYDTEISEKIAAIKEWKENNKNKYNLFQTEVNVQDYLIPLVTCSEQIQNKENEIAIKRQQDNKVAVKKGKISAQAIVNYNNYHNNPSNQTYIIPKSRYPINEYLLEDSKKNINFFSDTFLKSKIKENDSDFLSVYKKLSTGAVENNKIKKGIYNKRYREEINHPGTYRIFQNEEGIDYHAWSCCMKENKISKGCQKIIERKNKWNFE